MVAGRRAQWIQFSGKRMDTRGRHTDDALVERRQEQVIGAAVGLFARQGYYRTTVQQIAKKAGVSPGLIYQYFSDKDDILLHSILDVVAGYQRGIPAALAGVEDPLARFVTAVRTYCRVVDERRDATVLAYRSTKSLPEPSRKVVMQAELESNGLIAECIQACIDQGLFQALDVEFLTHQLVMFAHSWALKYWRLGQRYTLEQYLERGLDLYLNASLTQAGREQLAAMQDRQGDGSLAGAS